MHQWTRLQLVHGDIQGRSLIGQIYDILSSQYRKKLNRSLALHI
jgi:hypothetical protein